MTRASRLSLIDKAGEQVRSRPSTSRDRSKAYGEALASSRSVRVWKREEAEEKGKWSVGQGESPPRVESRSAGETEGVLFVSTVRGKTLNSTVPNLTPPVP